MCSGLYVKAGQAIGIQVAILPKPYHVLAQMFDSAEPVSLDAVRTVIHSELGMWPEEIFAEFDAVPIGSAVRHIITTQNLILNRICRVSPKSIAPNYTRANSSLSKSNGPISANTLNGIY